MTIRKIDLGKSLGQTAPYNYCICRAKLFKAEVVKVIEGLEKATRGDEYEPIKISH
jgi:hypothetical protein